MKFRLIIDLDLPPSTDWPNTYLAGLQQSVGESYALADHLALNDLAGESITSIRAQMIDAPGHETVVEVLGGTYRNPEVANGL